jgi:threonine dehydrogenase-like Zn-dependent dehydrogenase
MQTNSLTLVGPKQICHTAEALSPPTGAQALVRVHTVGLCATDLSLYDGSYRAPSVYPICFGHEWSGVVEAVGDGVTQLQVGDKVVGECSLWCGTCAYCARDKNLCKHVRKFGITTNGAARTLILQDERYLHRAAPTADLMTLAFAEPLAVAAQGIARGASAHDTDLRAARILILGGGMIGLACLLALRLMYDCQSIALFDLVESRVQRAYSLGAIAAEGIENAVGGRNDYRSLYGDAGYDMIFETTGVAGAFKQALDLVRPSGTIVNLGFIETAEISPRLLTIKAARIVGSIGGSGMFEDVLPVLEQHVGTFETLITHVFAPRHIDRAFETATQRNEALKIQIAMHD